MVRGQQVLLSPTMEPPIAVIKHLPNEAVHVRSTHRLILAGLGFHCVNSRLLIATRLWWWQVAKHPSARPGSINFKETGHAD